MLYFGNLVIPVWITSYVATLFFFFIKCQTLKTIIFIIIFKYILYFYFLVYLLLTLLFSSIVYN